VIYSYDLSIIVFFCTFLEDFFPPLFSSSRNTPCNLDVVVWGIKCPVQIEREEEKKKQLCKLIQMMIRYKWREKKKGETDSVGVEELGGKLKPSSRTRASERDNDNPIRGKKCKKYNTAHESILGIVSN